MAAFVAVLAVAMLSGQPAGRQAGVAGATSQPSPSAAVPAVRSQPQTTPPPSAAPLTTPEPSPRPSPVRGPSLAVTATVLRPWVDPFEETRAHVLVEVTNRGDADAYLTPGETTYRVTSPDGEPVAGSRFAHVFPPVVPPGGRAWLMDTLSATFVDRADLDGLEIELARGSTRPSGATADGRLAVEDVEWRTSDGGGIEATGVVVNRGTTAVNRIAVAVILLGPDGEMVAGVYDVEDVKDLAPGDAASFSTDYPGTPPVNRDEVASTEAVAIVIPD